MSRSEPLIESRGPPRSPPRFEGGLPIGSIQRKGSFSRRDPGPQPSGLSRAQKLYRSIKGEIPVGDYEIPLGQAHIARHGEDVTIVAWAAMVHTAMAAAETLESEGISVEIIDLQTLFPLDWETMFSSVAKTGRLVIVQEDMPIASVGSEVAAKVADEMFWNLDAPIRRVTPPHTHIPYSPILEDAYIPQAADVVRVVSELSAV